MIPTHAQILQLLRSGDGDRLVAFVRALPDASLKDTALSLVGSGNPGIVVVGLSTITQEYCVGRSPAMGAPLASALHERARELVASLPAHGLLPSTVSGLALNHLRALSQLGQNDALVGAADKYIALYGDEPENRASLRTLRIAALVTLERFDEAETAVRADLWLRDDPINGMEIDRLVGHIEQVKGPIFGLRRSAPQGPTQLSDQQINKMMQALGKVTEGSGQASLLQTLASVIEGRKRLDVSSAKGLADLGDLIDRGEALLGGGGTDSELAIGNRIRRASSIFVHGTPPHEQIQHSLSELRAALQWAEAKGIRPLQNDAHWGIYLCHSRLKDSSSAADALLRLRNNLESRRDGIAEPTERAGVFGQYRYLFPALCEHLYKAGRTADLLDAIESSKGRAIADRLTAEGDDIVTDRSIYECVARLPQLCREYRFHYASYFVDEGCAYAVLIDKTGRVHMAPSIALSEAQIRKVAREVAPERWGMLQASLTRIANASTVLAPLVAWLGELFDAGVLARGEHLVVCLDDTLHNVPMHYLELRGGILLDWLSVSKVHSAFLLDRVLAQAPTPPEAFTGFIVPAREDCEGDGAAERLAAFEAPIKWLEKRLPHGAARMSREAATVEAAARTAWAHRIVHFSVHGWFPPDENPFTDSYLLMSGPEGLPSKEAAATTADKRMKLTPEAIFRLHPNAAGSHISTMACVSGLSREGVAGDALGMDWAFLNAGASAVLSSHWFVNVHDAAAFFERFYDLWLDQKRTRAEALREAMLGLLGGDTSPASLQRFAGFSLTGDFR